MNAASARRCARRCPMSACICRREVLPEIREFERASTTAVCAVVGPLLAAYLDRLQARDSRLGLPKLHVMGSSRRRVRHRRRAAHAGDGGGIRSRRRRDRGGAGRHGSLARPNLISFDMGGTTAKASVIADGEIAVTAEYEVGGSGHANRWMHGTGHPIRVPVIDLAEVSAGGGIDRLGRSRRRAEGRAAQRRRRSGPAVLRRRRHAADGDRCRCGAGLSRSRGAARRRAARRSRRRGARDR